tara:strand:+ start:20651 stop:25036 length:4386 start_codon:yes stop_codon:yes gene_type:complete
MSRRYVKTSKFDSLGKIKPVITAIVSTKDNLQSEARSQSFFKRNYIDAVTKIIPKFYFYDEEQLSGTYVPFTDQLINSHMLSNDNKSTILPVSSVSHVASLSAINTPVGFAKYFFKQRSPAAITPDDFERNILRPLSKTYNNFTSSGAFLDYVSGTMLPSIPCAISTALDLATLSTSSYANDSSGTHAYLSTNLGWMYFLNRAGPTGGFDPSSSVAELMVNFWRGRSVVLEDTMSVYQEYLWRNQVHWTGVTDDIIPVDYVSSTGSLSGVHTSGTQLLEKLTTLNSIVYSPHFLDSPDQKVKTAFTAHNTNQAMLTEESGAGPFARFIEAISYSLADRVTEASELNTLYDIGKCPDEFLELLGELIGWKFLGSNVDKWRVQLRNAVEIYKKKGTKASIQLLLDSLFGEDTFNIETNISELWESYIPDMLYYSLATSSAAFKNFDVYDKDLAVHLGIPHYDATDFDTNIKYAVDTIISNLVKEFPDSFILGGKPFPTPQLVFGTDDALVYDGLWHLILRDGEAVYRTGFVETPNSVDLEAKANGDFVFHYRNRDWFVPPYEKRQYYTNISVTNKMSDRIEFWLKCYGVDSAFAEAVSSYIKDYTNESVENSRLKNSFLLLGNAPTYAPNYSVVINNATKNSIPDPISLLSLWNGKSSNFLVSFDSSSFDWASNDLRYDTFYGLGEILPIIEQVVPAHAIPEILVSLSSVEDSLEAINDNDCREIRPNYYDVYEGSGQVTTNFDGSALDMELLAGANSKHFRRGDVDDPTDLLHTGSLAATDYTPVKRNSLRRRSYKNTLPETKLFMRNGRNNPGSLEFSSATYDSNLGYLPLGYIVSELGFKSQALAVNTVSPFIGNLIKRIEPVWEICQNLNSSSSFYGFAVSNTFPSRGKVDLTSSDCMNYGRRGQLEEIIYTMNRVHDMEKFLQASSIVSGYLHEDGTINAAWPSSTPLVSPMDLSSWYVTSGLNVVRSIANALIENEISDDTLHYYEHFEFGRGIMRFFSYFTSRYGSHPLSDNYAELSGGPNIFSHTYGPLIYNSGFNVQGSALEASSYIQAASPINEVNISYYGGSGILSPSGMNQLGNHDLGTSSSSGVNDVYFKHPEFYNKHLVSGIELVDTSSPGNAPFHPTFSLFKLTREKTNQYDLSKYLVNNSIIKYHRSTNTDVFPRVRVTLDNTDADDKSRNFLEPECEYTVDLKVHSSDVESNLVGGQTLGCIVRTQPENGRVWVFNPAGLKDQCGLILDSWVSVSVPSIQDTGISVLTPLYQTFALPEKNIDRYAILDPVSIGCYEDFVNGVIEGGNPESVAKLGQSTLELPNFRFSTYNNKATVPSPDYVQKVGKGKVHRTDQKYVIEFFLVNGHTTKFIAIEEISIANLTNQNELAAIDTTYGKVRLGKKELKSVFKHFKDMATGINSRNSDATYEVMELSGGARSNYRDTVYMYQGTKSATTEQVDYVDIDEW